MAFLDASVGPIAGLVGLGLPGAGISYVLRTLRRGSESRFPQDLAVTHRIGPATAWFVRLDLRLRQERSGGPARPEAVSPAPRVARQLQPLTPRWAGSITVRLRQERSGGPARPEAVSPAPRVARQLQLPTSVGGFDYRPGLRVRS